MLTTIPTQFVKNGRPISSIPVLPDTLIFEAGYSGHRSEYITHLMKHINNSPSLHNRYVFALAAKIKNSLGNLVGSGNYQTVFFDFSENHNNSFTRSFHHWSLLSRYILANQHLREILFMEIDPYLLLLSMPSVKKTNLLIKGILFQPYVHFADQKNILHTVRYKYKNLVLQKLATTRNKQIKQLFILNDSRGVATMNQRMQKVFRFLADPVQPGKTSIDLARLSKLSEKFHIQKDKKILLLFGGIDRRKNVPTVIDAIRLLPDEIKNSVQLLIAGKFHPETKKEYLDYIAAYSKDFPISCFDGFVPDEERDALFVMADTVVMVYRNFYSSSGIMGHTMKYGKKVIVSDQGLMKNMAEEYQPAMIADPTNAKDISNVLRKLLDQKNILSESIAENFLRTHSPYIFSKALLQTVED